MNPDNCINYCAFVEEDETCHGDCMTIPKLETLDQVDIDTASHSLIMEGDK